jgi:alkylated DNA repair dioxygenase AlkB
MDLFNTEITANKLPFDGEVNYYGPILSLKESQQFFDALMNEIVWQKDSSIMFGKLIVTDRKMAFYASDKLKYTYAHIERHTLPFTEHLLYLKELVEEKTGEQFNSCLLNLYHSGKEGMGWHTDDEKELHESGAIASLSLGAERNFVFKHKETKNKVAVLLERGSLLVMKGTTQQHWLHSLPKTTKVNSPRINLTFRKVHDLRNV